MPEPTSLRHHRTSPTKTEHAFRRATKTTPTGKWSATLLLASLLGLPALAAQAQDAPPPGAPPPASPAAPAEATPPPPPPPAVPPPVAEAAKPPTAAEAMPATRPVALPPIDVGAWLRVGSLFQKASDPSSVGDWKMDTAYIELHAGGKIHEKVGVTLNLNANMLSFGFGSAPISPVAIEDAIISFDFCDPFHLWVGHLLVPVDRSNAAGPFFMIPWNFPGFFTVGATTVISAPHEGPSGRNNGAVVWGELNEGQFKYLLGVFDNGDGSTSPLYSGRLNLAIIGKEPGFWGNASYFGDKDVLALGVGGQFMKHGSSSTAGDKDYSEINADLLGEFKLGGGAWATGEAAYYHSAVSDLGVKDSFYVLAALASGTLGVGNIQPMVRYQWANVQGASSKAWNIDGGLSYLVKGPALRVIATYSHVKIPDPMVANATLTGNSIQLGAQAIFF